MPVKVLAASVLAMVAEVVGKVMVVPSVPERVRLLVKLRVFPAVPVKVYVPVVKVFPLRVEVVIVAPPMAGLVRLTMVPFVVAPVIPPKEPELLY